MLTWWQAYFWRSDTKITLAKLAPVSYLSNFIDIDMAIDSSIRIQIVIRIRLQQVCLEINLQRSIRNLIRNLRLICAGNLYF